MKILHTVESYLPARHGMQEVVTQISTFLKKQGHDVTIATSYHPDRKGMMNNDIPIIEFDIKGNYVKGFTGEVKKYTKFLLDSNYDVIVNFAAQQWATDIMLPILQDIKGRKIFVPTGFSELNSSLYEEYYRKMKNWMKNYDCNVFLSNNYQDINFARSNGILKNIIIPNGANHKEFAEVEYINIRKLLNVDESWKLILSVGSHTGYKGHDSLFKIFKKLKTKKVALLIIGNNTSSDRYIFKIIKNLLNLFGMYRSLCFYSCKYEELKFRFFLNKKKIFVKQFSRKQTLNAYKQSDLFLFPSMVECSPIVLFESMASNTPFAVSDVGNSSEIISWSHGGFLLPTRIDDKGYSAVIINESSDLIDRSINDDSLLSQLSNDGNKAFRENFTWENIGAQYENLYNSILNNSLIFPA